jgi:hypothetical protein
MKEEAQEPQHEPAEAEREPADELLEMVLVEAEPAAEEKVPPARIHGVMIGVLAGFSEAGEPLVDHAENPTESPLVARSTVALTDADVGREAALMFEGGNPEKPLLMGLIHTPERRVTVAGEPVTEREGERLVFSAKEEIVLQCGKASITLTRAGKVLIRGAYLLTRSSGVNRIQGGSVQIN